MLTSVKDLLGADREPTYREKLQDDRWRARSRRMISAHPFCASCHRRDCQLNTHHLYYDAEREPWEYSDDELMVLCRECHKDWHVCLRIFRVHVIGRARVMDIKALVTGLAMLTKMHPTKDVGFAIAQLASERTTFQGLKLRWERQ